MIQKNSDKQPLLVDYTKKRAPVSGKHVVGESSSGTWRNLKDVNHHVSIIGASYSMFDSVSSLEESTRSLKASAPFKDEFSLPRRTKSSNAIAASRELRLPTKEGTLKNSAETSPSPVKFRIRRQSFERSNSFDPRKLSSRIYQHLQIETSTAETEAVSLNAGQSGYKDRSVGHERDRSASPAPGSFRNPIRRTKSSSASGGREVFKTSSRLGSCRSLLRRTKSMSQEAMDRCLATALCQVQEVPTSGPRHHLQRSMSTSSDENIGTLHQLSRSGSARSLRSKNTVETDNKTNSEDTSSTAGRRRVLRRRSSSKKDLDLSIEIKRSGSIRSLNHSGSWRNLMHGSISSQLTARTEFSDDCTAHLFVTGSRIKRHGGSRRDSSSDTLHKLVPEFSRQDSAPRFPRRKSSNGRLEDSDHDPLHDRAPRLPTSSGSRPPASVNLFDSLDTSFSYASSSDDHSTSSYDSFSCFDSSMRSLGTSISTTHNEKPGASLVRPLTPPPTGSQSFAARVA